MIDQSHNVTDPIESLMVSAMEIERAYIQAHLVDRVALATYQEENDALTAATDELAKTAKEGGVAAAGPKVKTALTCKSCHDAFRNK